MSLPVKGQGEARILIGFQQLSDGPIIRRLLARPNINKAQDPFRQCITVQLYGQQDDQAAAWLKQPVNLPDGCGRKDVGGRKCRQETCEEFVWERAVLCTAAHYFGSKPTPEEAVTGQPAHLRADIQAIHVSGSFQKRCLKVTRTASQFENGRSGCVR